MGMGIRESVEGRRLRGVPRSSDKIESKGVYAPPCPQCMHCIYIMEHDSMLSS